jgi:hypothetical protein
MKSRHNDVNNVGFEIIFTARTEIQIVNEANEPIKDVFIYEVGSVAYFEPAKLVYQPGTSEQTDEKGEVILGCFESSEKELEFIASHDNYATDRLTVVLNNPKVTPFHRIVMKKQQPTRKDVNEPQE